MKNSIQLIISVLTGTLLCVIILLALLIHSLDTKAQNQDETPVSEIHLPEAQTPILKISGKEDTSTVYLQSLDIQVEVNGNIASTRFTMSFKNRTDRILEGELLFPLPDGISVSSYALDINGKMREAVPVEKAKATQVFEEIEQRRVDPGLLEKVEGNNFRIRIYPIPPNGTRTISIGYEEELSVENRKYYYRLPMDYKETIEFFSVKATVWKAYSKPQIQGKLAGELIFDELGENFVANFTRKNYQSEHSLVFSLPAPIDIPQTLMQSASGSYYFTASCLPKLETRPKQWSDRIGIIWDASLSGRQRDVQKELDVLKQIIHNKKNLEISLYLLSNRLVKKETFQIKNGNWTSLRQTLETVVYDGGSNFSAIHLNNIVSDEFLLFSDGLSTLSDADFVPLCPEFLQHPIHCIVSSPRADYNSMKWIASQTKGKFINLNALSQSALTNELFRETLHFLGIKANNDVREVYPSVSMPVQGNFSVAGILEAQETTLTLLFGYGNRPEKRIAIKLNTQNAVKQGNIARVWAQKKINELDMRYEQNKDELTDLGQQFGIVTRNTSLIVLETLQDYITYNIVPPAELQAEYYRWKKGRDEEIHRLHQNFLQEAINVAKNLQQWWNINHKPVKTKYPKPEPSLGRVTIGAISADELNSQSLEGVSEMELLSVEELQESRTYGVEYAEMEASVQFTPPVVVADRSNQTITVAAMNRKITQPVIQITPPKQNKEYFKKLTGKAETDYRLYLELREDYIHTPTFYFDMADWFFRLKDKEKALRILTCIADIDLENASLYRLLGYRLKEYKEYALEAYICQKVIQWRPMEPQSYRDYALALADNRNYQASLDSLYSLLTQSYASNISQQSSGIEEVVVTEINRLIAQNQSLNISAIDKNLIKATPVDIRVVINWNMNNVDIDLHVKDPHNETCFYGHGTTANGGRISRDITQGYGPEQFMLKKAIPGKYEVFVNYFGDSQVKIEGPSTVMVEIYTSYSGKKEQRQVVCVQLSKEHEADENGLLKVAEFVF